MKTTNRFFITVSLYCILFFVPCFLANAQKLPNVQNKAIRAPTDVKIDGKGTEWGSQQQAYNHATDVFYTIANDDGHLYLTVQATEPSIINKILRGGIAFGINATGKKNDKGMPCITYPVFEANGRPSVGVTKRSVGSDPAKADPVSDSLMMAYNRSIKERSKFIEVTGIPGLDTLISVYNNDGIKVAQQFDNKITYTYELAIDLKLLGLSVKNTSKLAYHITLNGINMVNLKRSDNNSPARTVVSAGTTPVSNTKVSLDLDTSSFVPTDLWGEYTLAK